MTLASQSLSFDKFRDKPANSRNKCTIIKAGKRRKEEREGERQSGVFSGGHHHQGEAQDSNSEAWIEPPSTRLPV